LPCFLVVAGWVPSAYAQGKVSAPGNEGEAGPGPVFSDTGPDAAIYGAAAGYPVGTRAPVNHLENLVGTYSHFGEVFPSRAIRRATTPWLSKRAPEPTISYSVGTERLSIADYLKGNLVTGLLIAKDDTILYEHYQYARTDRDRFLSQSMAKTITAMLIGIVFSEGKIRSIDDTASTYVPGLAGKEYEKTSIRDLLHMSSGVAFTEVYDGHDDVAQLWHDLFIEPGRIPQPVSRGSIHASRRPEPNGTSPVSKPRSSDWCCSPPRVCRSLTISTTGSGAPLGPKPTRLDGVPVTLRAELARLPQPPQELQREPECTENSMSVDCPGA
jgi:hypothetical protein